MMKTTNMTMAAMQGLEEDKLQKSHGNQNNSVLYDEKSTMANTNTQSEIDEDQELSDMDNTTQLTVEGITEEIINEIDFFICHCHMYSETIKVYYDPESDCLEYYSYSAAVPEHLYFNCPIVGTFSLYEASSCYEDLSEDEDVRVYLQDYAENVAEVLLEEIESYLHNDEDE